ncbi:MAG: Hsp20/alpha crystallin family protein [Planctomycetota bacterium]|jgi:HSP20 family protein
MSVQKNKQRRNDFRRPLVDVYETDEEVVLQFELPGVSSSEVDVAVEGDNLRVETRAEGREETGEAVLTEFAPVNFYREFVLSRELDRDNVAASWNNGVLTLKVPKGGAKTHKIAIDTPEQ